MAVQVATTAQCKCIFGAATSMVSAQNTTVLACGLAAATITDITLPPFGMCSCPGNPAVAAAICGEGQLVAERYDGCAYLVSRADGPALDRMAHKLEAVGGRVRLVLRLLPGED